MPGKAKFQKHTAAELGKKAKMAKEKAGGAGGGGKGAEARKCQKQGAECTECKIVLFSIADIRSHYDSKHPKACFNEDEYREKLGVAKKLTEDVSRGKFKQQSKKNFGAKDAAVAAATDKVAGAKAGAGAGAGTGKPKKKKPLNDLSALTAALAESATTKKKKKPAKK